MSCILAWSKCWAQKGRILAFEITLDALPQAKRKPTRVKAKLDLPDLQPVGRDFAFVVDQSVEAEAILRIACGIDKTLVQDVTIFDLYAGKGVDPGKVSVAMSVTLQPREKTLTDAEIETFSAKLVSEVKAKTGAILRA